MIFIQYLDRFNITGTFLSKYSLVWESLPALGYAITAGIVLSSRSATRMMIFTALALLLFGTVVPSPMHVIIGGNEYPDSAWFRFMRATGTALFIILLYIFPDGRFVPRWTSALAVILALWFLVWPFFPRADLYIWQPEWLAYLALAGCLGTGLWAQLYRYRRVSSPEQRL